MSVVSQSVNYVSAEASLMGPQGPEPTCNLALETYPDQISTFNLSLDDTVDMAIDLLKILAKFGRGIDRVAVERFERKIRKDKQEVEELRRSYQSQEK